MIIVVGVLAALVVIAVATSLRGPNDRDGDDQ